MAKGCAVRRRCDSVDYGYDGDSDLEEFEEDPPTPRIRSAAVTIGNQPEVTPTVAEETTSLNQAKGWHRLCVCVALV